MPLPSPTLTDTPEPSIVSAVGTKSNVAGYVERRSRPASSATSSESGVRSDRRQFGSSHHGLSEAGRELAQAIDRYKLENHRRYITCDEMLSVLRGLGYQRAADPPSPPDGRATT